MAAASDDLNRAVDLIGGYTPRACEKEVCRIIGHLWAFQFKKLRLYGLMKTWTVSVSCTTLPNIEVNTSDDLLMALTETRGLEDTLPKYFCSKQTQTAEAHDARRLLLRSAEFWSNAPQAFTAPSSQNQHLPPRRPTLLAPSLP